MTAFVWAVADRNVAGMSDVPDGSLQVTLGWSASEEDQSFPWGDANYPSLLVLNVGLTLSCSAVAGNRRPRITITSATPAGLSFDWPSDVASPANALRRYEFAAGYSLDGALHTAGANQRVRVPLPEGLIMIPNSVLTVQIDGRQAGDTYPNISVHGMLLY